MMRQKTCIYPGCERPGRSSASARRPAAGVLRPRGAQRADRAPGARSGSQRERTSRPTEETEQMADEAYRAVFLRVHPTGKMVLSLTTEPDGKEAEYAAAGRRRARRSGARRQGRSRRHRPLRRRPRLQHEPVRRCTAAAVVDARAARSATRRSCSPAPALDAAPETLTWANGRGRRRRQRSRRSSRRSRTSPCTRTAPGAAARRRGWPRRAGGLSRLTGIEWS